MELIKKMGINQRAIILIVFLLFSFYFFTSLFSTGYHFTDDHEMIRIQDDLKHNSVWDVIVKWNVKDFESRFRPVFYFHRVIIVKIFGLNLLAWTVYHWILFVLSSIFLFLGLRKLDFSITSSGLFVFFSFIGYQTAIWWRLGVNETIGMFFLALGFYYLKDREKRRALGRVIFVASLILASWSKESFTLVVPAFVFLKFMVDKQTQYKTFKKTILHNYYLIIPMIVAILSLGFIYFYVGTNKIGYAGVDSNEGIRAIFQNSIKIFKVDILYFFLLILIGLVFNIFSVQNDRQLITLIKKLFIPILFCLFILLPNMVLYAKSGMKERYLIPSTIGLSYLIVALFEEMGKKWTWQKSITGVVLIWFIYSILKLSVKQASNFASEGRDTQNLLNAIIDRKEKQEYVLLVADPVNLNEATFSLNTYLGKLHQISLYAYPMGNDNTLVSASFSESLKNSWFDWFKGRIYKPKESKNPTIIVFFNKTQEYYFFKQAGLNINDYELITSKDSRFEALSIVHK